jgi:hypothetical protein
MKRVNSGSDEYRDAINADSDREVLVTTGAVTTKVSNTKGTTILAPTGNTTGMTMDAPRPQDEGLVKTIVNTTAFSVVVTISGMAFAAQDAFTFVAAAANVVGPSLQLQAVNVSTTSTPSMKWAVIGAAGFVAGTSAVV